MAMTAKKKCERCGVDFLDRTKDHRHTKCQDCRVIRKCRRCGIQFTSVADTGHCPDCGEQVIAEMASGDYLQKVPPRTRERPLEMRELTHETKHGTWHG